MSRSPSVLLAVAALAAAALAATASAQGPIAGSDATYPVLDLELPIQSLDRSVTKADRSRDVKLTLAADVLFAFNSAKLGAKAGPRIDQAVAEIKKSGTRSVQVVGHTDNRGTPAFNLGLSRRRADVVEKALAKKLGSGPALTATGRGETQPVAANETRDGQDSPKGRALNRRVEILIPTR
jgi:outer membrane protein OmpA-like peptidoglycan-associated protein